MTTFYYYSVNHQSGLQKNTFSKLSYIFLIQQGLEIRGFWFQKKTVQLKTALREVYTYVLKGFFFAKNRASSRLLAKIRVSQGYCYVVQCIVNLSGEHYW